MRKFNRIFLKPLFILFLFSFTVSLNSKETKKIPDEIQSVIKTYKETKTTWYIRRASGAKAGKVLYGPFTSKDQAISIWLYLGLKPKKDSCIAQGSKFITSNPADFYKEDTAKISDEITKYGETFTLKVYFGLASFPEETEVKTESQSEVQTEPQNEPEPQSPSKSVNQAQDDFGSFDNSDFGSSDFSSSDFGSSDFSSSDFGSSDFGSSDFGSSDFGSSDFSSSTSDFDSFGNSGSGNSDSGSFDSGNSDFSSSGSDFDSFGNQDSTVSDFGNSDFDSFGTSDFNNSDFGSSDFSGSDFNNSDFSSSQNTDFSFTDTSTDTDFNTQLPPPQKSEASVQSTSVTPPVTASAPANPEVEKESETKTVQNDVEFVMPKTDQSLTRYQKEYLQDYAPAPEVPSPYDEEEIEEYTILNPDEKDSKGCTLLMKAAEAGNNWELNALIKSGADVNLKDNDGWTALMYAVRYQQNITIINTLLNAGAKVKVRNNYNLSPLMIASTYNNNPEIISRLLSYYSVSEKEVLQSFILLLSDNSSSEYAKIAKVEAFIKKSVPLNSFYEGKTPLMYAAEFGTSTKLIKYLIDQGASPSIRSTEGKTAYDYAVKNKNLVHDDNFWALNQK